MPRLTEIPAPDRQEDGHDTWDVTCDGLPPGYDCPNVVGKLQFRRRVPNVRAFNGYLCETCADQRDAQQQDE